MAFTCAYCNGSTCSSRDVRDAKNDEKIIVSVCLDCGLAQLNDIPDDSELETFYGSEYRVQFRGQKQPANKHVFRAGSRASERLQKMSAFVKSGDRLLDIGAGGGEFTYLATQMGLVAQGIDLATDYLEFAQDVYRVTLRNIGIEDIPEGETYQVVTMFHVLEHLPRPGDAFARIHGLLEDGGIFVMEVPNLEAKNTAPGNFFFKAHTMYFTQVSLELIASRYFDVLFFENDRNLFTVMRKRPLSAEKSELREKSVATSLSRLENKTFAEYAMHGGSTSILRKGRQVLRERMAIAGKTPKAILDDLAPAGLSG